MSQAFLKELEHNPAITDAAGFDRLTIMSYLLSRVVIGQELHDPQLADLVALGDFCIDAHEEAWPLVNLYLRTMTEMDPSKALETAVGMALIPHSQDPEQDKVNSWMRTNGLTLLGEKAILSQLESYLNVGKHGTEMRMSLVTHLHEDISRFDTEEAFTDPQGFSTLQTIFVCLGLSADLFMQDGLTVLAKKRLADADVQKALSFAAGFPGCEQFKTLLK